MNSLLTRSGLSLESFESERPPSIISFATDTSIDTLEAQGIGTLSGRVIYEVGDVPLRAFENLVIRRQLGKVLSAFPHEDDVVMRDIEIIYDHTLELSRYLATFRVYQVNSETNLLSGLVVIMRKSERKHCEHCSVRLQPVIHATYCEVW
jgi:hypothetical protein